MIFSNISMNACKHSSMFPLSLFTSLRTRITNICALKLLRISCLRRYLRDTLRRDIKRLNQ